MGHSKALQTTSWKDSSNYSIYITLRNSLTENKLGRNVHGKLLSNSDRPLILLTVSINLCLTSKEFQLLPVDLKNTRSVHLIDTSRMFLFHRHTLQSRQR